MRAWLRLFFSPELGSALLGADLDGSAAAAAADDAERGEAAK